MLSGSLELKSPGLKCPPTFKTIALNSSTKKGPATWTHLTSIIIVFSSSFTTNFANFWIRLQYFNLLIVMTGKTNIYVEFKKNSYKHKTVFCRKVDIQITFQLYFSHTGYSVIIIIFSTDAFARRECSLLLPPIKEGRGIIQLRYAPRS